MDRIRRFLQFLREVRQEGARVQWPRGRQTLITTGVVLVFVAVTGAYLALVDVFVSYVMEWVLQ